MGLLSNLAALFGFKSKKLADVPEAQKQEFAEQMAAREEARRKEFHAQAERYRQRNSNARASGSSSSSSSRSNSEHERQAEREKERVRARERDEDEARRRQRESDSHNGMIPGYYSGMYDTPSRHTARRTSESSREDCAPRGESRGYGGNNENSDKCEPTRSYGNSGSSYGGSSYGGSESDGGGSGGGGDGGGGGGD